MGNLHRHLLAVAPASGNRTGDGEADIMEANFDTNMVIILAALLCALVCALGLNSMVRCALRCSRRMGIESAEQAAARLSATGLKKSTLRKIPIAVYGSEGLKFPATECPICLAEFVDGEKVRVLPRCNHGFHVSCIDTWLGSHSSCPNCRHSLLGIGSSAKSAPSNGGGQRPESDDGNGGQSEVNGGGEDHVVVEVVVVN